MRKNKIFKKMASNIMNKSKDNNQTTISESSEENLSQDSLQKYPKNHLVNSTKIKTEYNEEFDPDVFIRITEGLDPKKKKHHSSITEKVVYQLISSFFIADTS